MVKVHRALDGVAAQMQRADVAFFGNADFGQVRLGAAQAAVGVSWHGVGRMEGKGVYFIRVSSEMLFVWVFFRRPFSYIPERLGLYMG